jgi:hypothetical protein
MSVNDVLAVSAAIGGIAVALWLVLSKFARSTAGLRQSLGSDVHVTLQVGPAVAPSDNAPAPIQKSLERYDVLDRIAVGGMAEVFLAKAYGAHGFEKTLALKRILPDLASDPEFAAQFIAEAKVAVRLSHANIVQVFDFGRIGETLFIAMEFVDGLDLAAMLRKFKDERRQVPLPAAFHIAIEIVNALDFAHSHNIVHRDISPSNILISRAGEVKIADFGIAIAASSHRGGVPRPGKVMGKWRYMSPEQSRGDSLDTRSDLFSAASVMFELFTGEKLFPGDEAENIIKNIETMPIPKMSRIRPGLPSRLDDVLALALARKPIDRPSRPTSILRSLFELSHESSIMASALDVAEAVASVLPVRRQAARGAFDDAIRRQLADAVTTRHTETERSPSAVFRKLDGADASELEQVDDTVRTAAPQPLASRGTTELLQASAAMKAGLGSLDGDATTARHTEDMRLTRDELLARLSGLLPSQFEMVLFRARIPMEHLSGVSAPQAMRAMEVIRYLEQQNRLWQLAKTLQEVSARDAR